MKNIYLTSYSVKGIKTLDKTVSLSFYKKTITKDLDTQAYNVKGIYGMNGSGKSGIVTSVEILRNMFLDSGYLNDSITQKNLDAIINKKVGELTIKTEFICKIGEGLYLFHYIVTISKNTTGKFVIAEEQLKVKKATSKGDQFLTIFVVKDGEIISLYTEEKQGLANDIKNKTMNLLSATPMAVIYRDKMVNFVKKEVMSHGISGQEKFLVISLAMLAFLPTNLYVYLDQADYHRRYFLNKAIVEGKDDIPSFDFLPDRSYINLEVLSVSENYVIKNNYDKFVRTIKKLYEFLHIFKPDLQEIEIDRKEDHECYVCDLIMVYDSYKIHAEFESTGIKKLIKLFAFIREMVRGGIVFIDEFDSNLHDVYLCALLEYLMEYGKGQLCFTTHNVGPMDVLKQHKKSIDFLSEDHQIYPWKTNGNYSPSKLYRNGMIEGSPFNVDSIDFIGVFGTGEEDE